MGVDDGGQNSFDLLFMGYRDRCEFGINGQISIYDPENGSTMESIAESKFRKYCSSVEDEIRVQKTESLDKNANATYDYRWGFHSRDGGVNKAPPSSLKPGYPATPAGESYYKTISTFVI
jgi:hypothetical protein